MGGVQRGSRANLWSLACLASVLALGCGRTDKNGASPEPVSGLTPPASDLPNCAMAIAGDDGRHCAAYQDGSVWCWGAEGNGDGPSNFVRSAEPERVAGVARARRVFVGPRHSCALSDDGLLCWGDNESGQIDDSGTFALGPTSPGFDWGTSPAKGIGLGETQTCALNFESHLFCRGSDISRVAQRPQQLMLPGPPQTTMSSSGNFLIDDEGVLFALTDWANASPMSFYGDDNAWYGGRDTPGCVLKRSGSVWCTSDELDLNEPRLLVKAGLGEGAEQAGTGTQFMCALKQGKVWCEGLNSQGQAGGTQARAKGHFIDNLEDVRVISVNDYSACSIVGDGSVWCWGNYAEGKHSNEPVRVSGCAAQLNPPLQPLNVPLARPTPASHLSEASLARAQAMCVCAFGAQADDGCFRAEDHAPIGACLTALTPNDGPRLDCLATLDWRDVECYAQQPCDGSIPPCPIGPGCPPTQFPSVESYCRRSFCVDDGRPLAKDRFCNGVFDCTDQSDEHNCTADTRAFECNADTRILLERMCDGVPDCDDGADERFCP